MEPYTKLIRENIKVLPLFGILWLRFGDTLLIVSPILWSMFGSRPVFENRVLQMKGCDGHTPSTSKEFPSSVTVYIGDKSNKRELM